MGLHDSIATRNRLWILVLGLAVLGGGLLMILSFGDESTQRGAILPPVVLGESAAAVIPPADVPIGLPDPAPELPRELPVYEIVRAEISDDGAQAIAARFGVEGEVETSRDGKSKWIRQGARQVIIDVRTGATDLYEEDPDADQPEPTTLPSREQAEAIAREYVLKHQVMSEAALDGLTVTSGVSLTKQEWDPVKREHGSVVPLEMTVTYRGRLDGYPLAGAGAKRTVVLGGGGRILRMYDRWPAFHKGTSYTLKSLDEVIRNIRAGESSGLEVPAGTAAIELESVEVVYWAAPLPEEQPYYQPVFEVTGRTSPSGQRFELYVPAILDEYYENGQALDRPQLGR